MARSRPSTPEPPSTPVARKIRTQPRPATLLIAHDPLDSTKRIPPPLSWDSGPAQKYKDLVAASFDLSTTSTDPDSISKEYTLNLGSFQCLCCQVFSASDRIGRAGTRDLVGCFSRHTIPSTSDDLDGSDVGETDDHDEDDNDDDEGRNEQRSVGKCLQCILKITTCSFALNAPVAPLTTHPNTTLSSPATFSVDQLMATMQAIQLRVDTVEASLSQRTILPEPDLELETREIIGLEGKRKRVRKD